MRCTVKTCYFCREKVAMTFEKKKKYIYIRNEDIVKNKYKKFEF